MSTVVTAFGRLSPPTVGHLLLLKKLDSLAKVVNGDAILFLSQSQDSKKNPLSFNEKVMFVQQICDEHNLNVYVYPNTDVKTMIQVPMRLNDEYDNLIFVGGSDRVPEFEAVLNKYNNNQDKTGKIPFSFKSITVESAGERDPDADDDSGMSASKARALVASGDYESFKKAIPLRDPKPVYDAVRRGMSLTEKLQMVKINTKIDPIEFAAGLADEADEHGWDVAIDTVLAHLKQDPKYYTKLRKAGLIDKRAAAILDIKESIQIEEASEKNIMGKFI